MTLKVTDNQYRRLS